MAQTIKLKRSATQGAAPTTSNLALGEVAINTYDGKMYIKKDVGGTESIVEIGGVGGNSVSYLEAGMIEYEYTATSNQTTFSGSDSNSATLSYTANSIMVFLNGVLQDDGVDYTATNGTSVVFGTALAANDEVRIVAFTNVTTTSSLQDPTKLDAITTVNAQAAYSLTLNSSAYTPSSQNALIVSLNGITQEPGDSFTISGSTITFSPALVTGDVVDYIVDMGRAVTIGEYSGDLAVGGELEVTGDIIGDIRGATLFKAQAGESLAKGDVVHISGISGNTTVVSKADADDAAKMPAFGLVAAAASSGTPVDIYTFGTLSGLDTSSFSEGDELFVSTTAGTLTNSAPTGESSKLQKIAKVTRSDNSAGSVFIMGAGRSNATPNLDDGDIFIGNASNQAVTASLNTKIEDYLDAGTSTPSFSTINSGNITTTGYIAGPSTFTIDPAAVGDNTGTLVIAGNLQVDGTTTTINSTTMTVDDLNITLASGAANAAAANGAGITVDGASATLTYNSTPDAWSFNKNVGIGTSSPDQLLDVGDHTAAGNRSIRISQRTATNSTTYGGLEFFYDNSAGTTGVNAAIKYAAGPLRNDGELTFHTGASGSISERLRIDHNGNVGIGTASPSQALDVVGTIKGDSTLLLSNATTSSFLQVSTNILQFGTSSSDPVAFYANNAERMRIDSSGNVGIGITSMVNPLHVGVTPNTASKTSGSAFDGGALRLDGNLGSAGSEVGILGGANDGLSSGIGFARQDGSTWGTQLRFYTHSTSITTTDELTERMRIDANGNVGIGTTSPNYPLHINKSDSAGCWAQFTNSTTGTGSGAGALVGIDSNEDFRILQYESKAIEFLTSATERMRINSSGNVGIGTTSPEQLLEISSGTTPHLRITNTTNGTFDTDDVFGGVEFFTSDTGYDGPIVNGYIRSVHLRTGGGTGHTSADGGLQFGVSEGTQDIAAIPAMSIVTGGNVGIGTTSPSFPLEVNGGTGDGIKIKAGNTTNDDSFLIANSSDATLLKVDGTGDAYFYANGGELRFTGHSFYRPGAYGSGIHLSTNRVLPANENGSVSDNTEDLGASTYRFKDLYLSGGAYLGGTGAANHLDDYEEGTWTPALGGATTATVASSYGSWYRKIGSIIFYSLNIQLSTNTDTGSVQISIPFASSATFGNRYGGAYENYVNSSTDIFWYQNQNSSYIQPYATSGGAITYQNLSGKYIQISGMYIPA